ncbi:hypothetical protein ABID21_003673 [Pseudorhizobium tarimense]|uniref:DUF982 domain-containing protein n=2 Tax=Pseudorhizobium tarimense TaxID=1079109 RepID=A0ABV2HAJ5_9HYPH
MGSVIEVGFQLDWEHPVFVGDGDLLDTAILGPRAGLKYLQAGLPIRTGQTYWNAVQACSSALLGKGDLDHARVCFIAAYAECMFKIEEH